MGDTCRTTKHNTKRQKITVPKGAEKMHHPPATHVNMRIQLFFCVVHQAYILILTPFPSLASAKVSQIDVNMSMISDGASIQQCILETPASRWRPTPHMCSTSANAGPHTAHYCTSERAAEPPGQVVQVQVAPHLQSEPQLHEVAVQEVQPPPLADGAPLSSP